MALVIPRNGKNYIVDEGGRVKPITLRPITWKKENSWIRSARVNAGLSLRKLAAQAKMTAVELGELERGVRPVEPHEEQALCRELDLDF